MKNFIKILIVAFAVSIVLPHNGFSISRSSGWYAGPLSAAKKEVTKPEKEGALEAETNKDSQERSKDQDRSPE